jgi:hypothetical protein
MKPNHHHNYVKKICLFFLNFTYIADKTLYERFKRIERKLNTAIFF